LSALRAGVGRADITPSPGTPQGGWGAQTHQRGVGSDMPFFATALALSDDHEQVLIVEADAIGFDMEWTNRIIMAIQQQTGISRDRIRFSCSHTHSGPNTFRLRTISEGLEMALSYLHSLPERIAGAAWQAQRNLQPVRLAAGTGSCDIGVNRRWVTPQGARVSGRNWQGIVDRTVLLVRFDDLDEKPVAVVVHYACHPTIMAWENQWFTPDYPGMVRKVVEQQVGGTCLFLQGAAGDIGPRAGYTGDLQVYRRAGTILGLEAAKVALNLDTQPRRERFLGVLQSGAPIALYAEEAQEASAPVLRAKGREVTLPLRELRPIAEVEAEAERRSSELSVLRKKGSLEEIRAATARSTQVNSYAEMVRQYTGKKETGWEVQCIRVGPVAFVSTRGEPFTETSQRIVAGSPFEYTLFSGYSNGGFGYIPTRQAFAEGGYEIDASPFAADAAEKLASESLRMLKEVA
jgi:neutral/alkaline ceramidase-like enzyme